MTNRSFFIPSSDHALLMFYSCFTHALLLLKLKWVIIKQSLRVNANVICRVCIETSIYLDINYNGNISIVKCKELLECQYDDSPYYNHIIFGFLQRIGFFYFLLSGWLCDTVIVCSSFFWYSFTILLLTLVISCLVIESYFSLSFIFLLDGYFDNFALLFPSGFRWMIIN